MADAFDDWKEQELKYALSHTVDELVSTHTWVRENFADIRSAMLDLLCEGEAIPRETAEGNANKPTPGVVREVLSALASRPETQTVALRWVADEPTDYVQSVDPLTGSVVLAGIYLVLTTSFTVKYRSGPKGKEVVVELRRKQGIPASFMRTLIEWLRGGK